MVLSSPPALLSRKWGAALCGVLSLVSISCFGQPVFLTVRATPYDRQMTRVTPVLAGPSPQQSGSLSWLEVNRWMTQLRAMPYQYAPRWQTPAEVDGAQAADCKGKAVALYAQMRKNGAKNVRIVIGKHHIFDSATHAWLQWETPAGSYMLDPTFNDAPVKTAEIDPMVYLPFYAYDGARKYRVSNAGFLAPTTRVASYTANQIAMTTASRTSFAPLPPLPPVRSFSATTRYLTTSGQGGTAGAEPSRWNSRNVGSFAENHQLGSSLTRPVSGSLMPARPIQAVSQNRLTTHVRQSTTTQMKRPHVRYSAHHRRHIRSQAKRLAAEF